MKSLDELIPPTTTFSMVVRDEKTGWFGAAVSSAAPAVGAVCSFVRAGVGAICSQSFVNSELGRKGLDLIGNGLDVEAALRVQLDRDPHAEYRQIIGIDRVRTYAFTGSRCVKWHGSLEEKDFAVAGNMLVSEQVIEEMCRSLQQTPEEDLAERLLKGLEAGQAAGGDKRGKQSAAILIGSDATQWHHNLRVDDHPDPIIELRRVYNATISTIQRFRKQFEGLESIIQL